MQRFVPSLHRNDGWSNRGEGPQDFGTGHTRLLIRRCPCFPYRRPNLTNHRVMGVSYCWCSDGTVRDVHYAACWDCFMARVAGQRLIARQVMSARPRGPETPMSAAWSSVPSPIRGGSQKTLRRGGVSEPQGGRHQPRGADVSGGKSGQHAWRDSTDEQRDEAERQAVADGVHRDRYRPYRQDDCAVDKQQRRCERASQIGAGDQRDEWPELLLLCKDLETVGAPPTPRHPTAG